MLAAANDRLFAELARRLELDDDERFATNASRVAHRDELAALAAGAPGSRADRVLARAAAQGSPSRPCRRSARPRSTRRRARSGSCRRWTGASGSPSRCASTASASAWTRRRPSWVSRPGRPGRELAAEQPFEPLRHLDERVEVDAGLDAVALEQVDEILGRDVPVALGAKGQPPSPPTDASSTVAPASSAATAFGVARVPRVVEVAADRAAEPGDLLRQRADLPRRGDADRVGEDELVRAAEALREREDAAGSTSPSNGQPNATLIVTVAGRSAAARIRSTRAAASSTDAFAFRCENDSVAASVDVEPVERRRLQPLVALLVQHEPGVLDALAALDRRDHLLGAGHLRHAVVADEARRPRSLGRPAPASRFTSSARTAGASTSGSFCSPSRGPTSQRITNRNRTR